VTEDLYEVLQVSPKAEPEVIQAAYRKLAAKYHPDVCTLPDAKQRMQALNAAFEVLSDPVKRVEYDRNHRPVPRMPDRTYGSPSDLSDLFRGYRYSPPDSEPRIVFPPTARQVDYARSLLNRLPVNEYWKYMDMVNNCGDKTTMSRYIDEMVKIVENERWYGRGRW